MTRTRTRTRRSSLASRTTPTAPTLRFSPTAWAKLLYLRDRGETEVGGFGSAPADDLLFVEDVQLVRQECTVTTVAFDDEAVADFFDRQVDRGLRPEQFGRIWIHTHPGDCPEPSLTDERTFERVFGKVQWAVMLILARGGQTYARLHFNVGPGGAMTIPTCVDYSRPFGASDAASWEEEYQTNVIPAPVLPLSLPESWGDGFGLEDFANEEVPWPDGFAGQSLDDHDFDFERIDWARAAIARKSTSTIGAGFSTRNNTRFAMLAARSPVRSRSLLIFSTAITNRRSPAAGW